MLSIQDIKFDEKGLVPAIVTDSVTGEVLTLAYMNAESLAITLAEGRTCFFSRSRGMLWRKGETSGNYQEVLSVTADCDRDALVVRVRKAGPACHLGNNSCFVDKLFEIEGSQEFSLDELYKLIQGRLQNPVEGSYTTYLFQKGLDKILKKVGEESTEVIVAAKNEDSEEVVFEISDLVYHVMVLMVRFGISVDQIRAELQKRHVVDKKVKQETKK